MRRLYNYRKAKCGVNVIAACFSDVQLAVSSARLSPETAMRNLEVIAELRSLNTAIVVTG